MIVILIVAGVVGCVTGAVTVTLIGRKEKYRRAPSDRGWKWRR
jgi:hypothetical protein